MLPATLCGPCREEPWLGPHTCPAWQTLQASLRDLIDRHLPSKNQEAQDILMELTVLISGAAPTYQYRHHPNWDTTWMDLDETQIPRVLRAWHSVERRQILGGWEPVTEVSDVSH